METISFQSLRQSGREVNSIGGRQLSSGAPTPWIPGSDYPCAPVFSLPQQRPFWKARKGTIAQRRVTHIPFLKHHSSHTFGINRRIFYAALYWSLSNLREDFKSVQLYLKGICYRGCLCRLQRNPVWPTNTQHRQEKRPSAKKLEHNLAQMGGGPLHDFSPISLFSPPPDQDEAVILGPDTGHSVWTPWKHQTNWISTTVTQCWEKQLSLRVF